MNAAITKRTFLAPDASSSETGAQATAMYAAATITASADAPLIASTIFWGAE